ncbi:MAG: DinB family protein [Flavobacteriaceae bacterium]|nr:DinB family protein [Flavobacteriaceae bacterium]
MEYTIEHGIEILERTPFILQSFLKNLSDTWTMCNEGENTWSAYDIVGHLVHGEKTDWTQRLEIILSDDTNKTFTPFDRFAQFESSKGKSLNVLLEEFKVLRKKNLEILKSLDIQETQFELEAIHPSLGKVTLKELLAAWVAHDLGHIAQISRVMAKQYKHEVGPWQEYLTILHR